MRRTGKPGVVLVAVAVALLSAQAHAEAQLQQEVDRTEVGTEDTFRLTITYSGDKAPDEVQLPSSDDFEVLSTSEGSQMSYHLGGGGVTARRSQHYTLVMRANREGKLTIPPAKATVDGKTYRTRPIQIMVKKGYVQPPRTAQRQRAPNPFGNFPSIPGFPGLPDLGDDLDVPEDIDIPRRDSDLFLLGALNKTDVFVGEQVTFSLYLYARVDVSSMESISLPRFDGFWAEELEAPTQLSSETKTIDGVPYRAFLLRRFALFPSKAGKLTVNEAQVRLVTGFFRSERLTRKSNKLTLSVKALPGDPPAGMPPSHVGTWNLSADASETQVKLGQPVTVKVTLTGVGNIKNVTVPPLRGPEGVRIYDPTITDKLSVDKHIVGGRKTHEYLVVPQRTGTFVLPGLSFAYFDPEAKRYETTQTNPLTLTVEPGAPAAAIPGQEQHLGSPKNVLTAGGLRPLRHEARFEAPSTPLWQRGVFLPAALSPVGLYGAVLLFGLVRSRLSKEDEDTRRRRQAKMARKRLGEAKRLSQTGTETEFFGELERSVSGFISAKLGQPVTGLTRDVLLQHVRDSGIDAKYVDTLRALLEACDAGRFAPGAAGMSREQALSLAAEVMEAVDRR